MPNCSNIKSSSGKSTNNHEKTENTTSFVLYGFMITLENEEHSMCLICKEILANECFFY